MTRSGDEAGFVPHHRLVGGGGEKTSFVLHGALGSGQNFNRFVQKLTTERPDYQHVLVDLRHHGDSRGAPPPNTLGACAQDLFALARHLGREPQVLIGHSFGGKVAIEYARQAAGQGSSLQQVWVLDAVPGAQAGLDGTEIAAVLRAVRAVPMPAASRKEVVQHLEERAGLSHGLSEWMTTNLRRQGEHYVWTFNLDAIEELMMDYVQVDLWNFLSEARSAPEFRMVVAERSDRWTPELRQRAAAMRPETHVIYHDLPAAGHWVHVDNPAGLLHLLGEHLI